MNYFANDLPLWPEDCELVRIPTHRYVVAYDISDNRRRRKVAKVMESYATRVQGSVFEAFLTDRESHVLGKRLVSVANTQLDKLRMYPQCVRCQELSVVVLGTAFASRQSALVI